MKANIPMPLAHGFWQVTTDGDVEGRSTRDLGIHEGYIDNIAFALADKSYYSLRFKQVNPLALHAKKLTNVKVQVSLDIQTGTWDLNGTDRVTYFKQLLKGRDVTVQDGQYFACVTLVRGADPEAQERARQAMLKQSALNKLTAEEIKALNL